LLTLTTASAAVHDTVGTGAVPCHTDEEAAVVTEISRPPVLGIGHEISEILLEAFIVEALESSGIVEVRIKGVGDGSVLTEDVELELLGPPVVVPGATTTDVGLADGALGHFGCCCI